MAERKFDLIVYGASGYTGRQTAAYLRKTAPLLRLGIAGRSRDKLEKIAASIGIASDQVVVAESQDHQAVKQMCSQARVLVNTAGPFALHGEAVIQACVEHRTDYVDITGETPFVHDMIERFHKQAHSQGTRVIPFCGFDSVPSDIGTLWMIDELQKQSLEPRLVKSFFRVKGGFNGGTIASALNMAETGSNRQLVNPLLLVPRDQRTDGDRRRSKEPQKPVYDDDLGIWTAPFFMAPINSAVVRRSRALYQQLGNDYGNDFEYHERLWVDRAGRWFPSTVASLGQGLFVALTLSKAGRKVIRKITPMPGEGPSEQDMDEGFMYCRLVGKSQDGQTIGGEIKAKGDPGNRITVKILGESAKMLIESDRDQLPGGRNYGGILTPASGLGLGLKRRLESQGFTFSSLGPVNAN